MPRLREVSFKESLGRCRAQQYYQAGFSLEFREQGGPAMEETCARLVGSEESSHDHLMQRTYSSSVHAVCTYSEPLTSVSHTTRD